MIPASLCLHLGAGKTQPGVWSSQALPEGTLPPCLPPQPSYCVATAGCWGHQWLETSLKKTKKKTANKEYFLCVAVCRGAVSFLTEMGDQEPKDDARKKKKIPDFLQALSRVGPLQDTQRVGLFWQ